LGSLLPLQDRCYAAMVLSPTPLTVLSVQNGRRFKVAARGHVNAVLLESLMKTVCA